MLTPKNNTRCQPANTDGFTKFEFVVSAFVFCILVGVLLNRIGLVQDETERAQVARVLGTMRAALQFKTVELIVNSKQAEAAKFVDQNPMDWLMDRPENYLGEYYSPTAGTLPKGNWYFDRSNKTLVYLLNNGKTFEGEQLNLLKFKVKFSDTPGNTVTSSGQPSLIKGIALDQVSDHDRNN
jgi:hypothetical protein